MNRLTLITQAGSVCLLTLKAVSFDLVQLPILYEPASRSAEDECHVEIHALLPERLHPIIITRSGPFIIFPIAKYLLNLTVFQIFSDADRPDKRRTHDALMLEWEIKQDWDALIGAFLILCRHIEKDILPAVFPVIGQMISNAFRPFGEKKEFHIPAL